MSVNKKTRSPLAPNGTTLTQAYALPTRGRLLTVVMTAVAVLIVVVGHNGAAIAAPKNVVVNCGNPNASIQDAVDNATGPTTIRFLGLCEEDVNITKDDITLDGQDTGEVSGTISFDGAHRGIVQNATVSGSGDGIMATNGASVLIRNNDISDNGFSGVIVTNGANASITNNSITGNGGDFPNDAAGILLLRAVAVGQGNTISNNKYAGIAVYNFSTYRTGSFIGAAQPNNEGPFEDIDVGADGLVAVDIAQMSFADLRQVLITGNVTVRRKSMLQIRGDFLGPVRVCSQIDGNLIATAILAQARVRFTNVTGSITGAFVDGDPIPFGVCPP